MRMSITSPGNNFRLGACEEPPSIISMYIGDNMTSYLADFKDGKSEGEYVPATKMLDP